MTVPFPDVQGFAGATGVGLLVMTAIYLITIVFATNLPEIAKAWVQGREWGAFSFVPLVLVAYVVGLLAMAAVDWAVACAPIAVMQAGPAANQYIQLEQEAAILSGGVVAFALFAVAALLHVTALPGWKPTLLAATLLCVIVAAGSFLLARNKHSAAEVLSKAIASSSGKPTQGSTKSAANPAKPDQGTKPDTTATTATN